MSEQLQVTGTVDAPPEAVFALLADPARHTEIDGAGMLRGVATGGPIRAAGQKFTMNMNNAVLDDYQVENTVTVYEPGRRIAWSPTGLLGETAGRLGDMTPGGHSFVWELAPNPTGGTDIVHTYDWSGCPDERFKALMPFLKEDQLAETIQRIGKAAQV